MCVVNGRTRTTVHSMTGHSMMIFGPWIWPWNDLSLDVRMCVCEQPLSIPKHRVIYILDGYGDVEVHHDFLLHDTLSSLQSETIIKIDFIRSTVIRISPHKCKDNTMKPPGGGASFLKRWGSTILGGSVRFLSSWCSGDGACEVLAKQSAGSGEEMVVRSSPGNSGWVLKDS